MQRHLWRKRWPATAAVTIGLALLAVSHQPGRPATAQAAQAMTASCAAATLTLQPGLNPPSPRLHLRIAPNVPHGHFSVSVPVYPGATPLTQFIGSPFPEVSDDAYLQTASAEYQTADGRGAVQSWISSTFHACGWHDQGSWTGNTTPFGNGLTFQSNANPNLTIDISFGDRPSGGTYIAYGVDQVTLPRRPKRSYLHGPFTELRITLKRGSIPRGQAQPVWRIEHTTLRVRSEIRRLVATINGIRGYRTVAPLCIGGGPEVNGPAWLTFIRANGSAVHAYERGPGVCLGLAVNAVRWMTDPGQAWKQILSLAAPGRG